MLVSMPDFTLRLGLVWLLVPALPACTKGPPATGTTAPPGSGSTDATEGMPSPPSSTGTSDGTPGLDSTSSEDPSTSGSTGSTGEPTITRIAEFVAAVHGMAVDAEGRLWFSDSFTALDTTARVYRLEPPYTGKPEPTSISGPRPAGLAFVDGALHVCDVGAGTVTRYDDVLAPTQTWSMASPWNVAALPSGDLVAVTFDDRLLRLGADGTVDEAISDLAAPFDLAPTPAGALWISEQGAGPGEPGRLARWSTEGEIELETRHAWANPEGLAVDPQGNLWVAETELQQLLRVSPDGEVELMAEVDGLPIVITPLPSGDLLVSVTGPAPHLLRVELGG